MTRENSGNGPRQFNLTDEEAVTLRRVGFGESEVRTLRRADLDRLLRLRLIEVVKDGMGLTALGKEHLESLPRNVFASPSRPPFGLGVHIAEADQAARLLVPQGQPGRPQSIDPTQSAHRAHFLDSGVSQLQSVVRDSRVEMMDVVEADIASQPVQGARQAQPGRASE